MQSLAYSGRGHVSALTEGAAELSNLVTVYRYARMSGLTSKLQSNMWHILWRDPYLLNAYYALLLSKEIAEETQVSERTITNAILRGQFNEGRKTFDAGSSTVEGSEASDIDLSDAVTKKLVALWSLAGGEVEKVPELLKEHFHIEGDLSSLSEKAVSAVLEYVESSSHTQLQPDVTPEQM